MKQLFWGFFFICLNFNLNFNQHSLNILPDFAGYFLMLQGIKDLSGESPLFEEARPFAMGMAVYSAILWVGALFGVASGGLLMRLLNLVAMAARLYISWLLIRGVQDMEDRYAADLNGTRLFSLWKSMLICNVAAELIGLLIHLVNIGILAFISVGLLVAVLIVTILYLLAWKQTMEAWEGRAAEPDAEK